MKKRQQAGSFAHEDRANVNNNRHAPTGMPYEFNLTVKFRVEGSSNHGMRVEARHLPAKGR